MVIDDYLKAMHIFNQGEKNYTFCKSYSHHERERERKKIKVLKNPVRQYFQRRELISDQFLSAVFVVVVVLKAATR